MALVICTKCSVEQEETEYLKDPRKRNGRASSCKACNNLRNSEWAKNNREYKNAYKKSFIQKGRERELGPKPDRCELCGERPSKKDLAWDHNHSTQKGRGWLCFDCNTGLGKFGDNPALLARALRYLQDRGHSISKSFIG